jgi:tetratricopeptide (TPR) repeat protein
VEETLADVHRIEDDSTRAQVLTVAAHYYLESGDLVRSVQLQSRSVEAARRAGKHTLELTINANLGLIYARLGLYAQAQTTLEAGLARVEVMVDRRLHANTIRHLGYVYWSNGDSVRAQQMEEQALKELTEIGDAYGVVACLAYLGYIFEGAGELTLAAEHLAQARAGFADMDMDAERFEAQAVEARVALAQGRKEEARQLAVEAWNYLNEHGAEGMELPSLAYACVADVFSAINRVEPGIPAREVIEAGHRELMQSADKISNAEWRQSFLENVAGNREIIDQWERINNEALRA